MENKTLYVVVRYAVYLQGIFGVFSSKKKAEACLNRLLNTKGEDNHHTYVVVEYELDVDIDLTLALVKGTPEFDWDDFDSRVVLYKTKGDMEE